MIVWQRAMSDGAVVTSSVAKTAPSSARSRLWSSIAASESTPYAESGRSGSTCLVKRSIDADRLPTMAS